MLRRKFAVAGRKWGSRLGTENLIGIAGFGGAAQAAIQDIENGLPKRLEKLRNILEKTLEDRAKETIFVGKEVSRLSNTSLMVTEGWKGESQVMAMDLAGFAISAGSACSSGKVKSSAVLQAMGLSPQMAGCAIRVSLGPDTQEADVLAFADAWASAYDRRKARAG